MCHHTQLVSSSFYPSIKGLATAEKFEVGINNYRYYSLHPCCLWANILSLEVMTLMSLLQITKIQLVDRLFLEAEMHFPLEKKKNYTIKNTIKCHQSLYKCGENWSLKKCAI